MIKLTTISTFGSKIFLVSIVIMEFGDVYFNGEGKTGDPEKKPRSKARTTANSSHEARGRNHNQTNKPIN